MAKARRNTKVRLLGLARRNRPALMMSTALQATTLLVLSLPVHAQPAPNALPTGFAPTAGALSAAQAGNKLTITQTTQRGAANFQSYNVGRDAAVQYVQPNSAAVTLNRVVGPDPSQIAGRIDANGQIILINQSGVNFYKGSQVNTAGLIVTTANVTDKNFMAGKLAFDQASKNPNASIENAGNITIKDAGLAALVAPQVRNSGTITAQMGHVVLAGAKTTTIDLYGDGMLSLDVSNQVTQAPVGKDGKTATALVTNEGVIIADGGTVQLTARAADGIVQNLVQAGGKIRAATMGDHTGVVALNGVGGSIVVEGQLSAPGIAPGTKGGNIEVATNGNVVVETTARINASGKAGGGTVAIGTTLDRAKDIKAAPKLVAANTTIKQGAKIAADATGKGNGGRVVVLSSMSSGTTRMDGAITAKGGKDGGNGGFAEVSGGNLGMQTGQIDASAPHGATGLILFDPQDLDIVGVGTGNGNVTAGGVDVGAPDQNTNITVSAAVLTALVGDLKIEASRNLTVDAPVLFTQIAGQSVTMLAGANLTVNQAVSTLGGDLVLRAAVATDGVTPFNHTDPTGAIAINAALGSAATGNITLSAGTGGIGIGANVTGVTVDLSTTGAVNQTGGVITATTLQSTSNVDGNVSLTQSNKIGAIGNFTVTGSNNFTLNDSVGLAVNGALVATGGNVQLQTSAGAGITVGAAGSVNVGTGTAGFTTDKFSITAGGAITAQVFELAPNSPGTMKIGTGGLLTSLTGITANLVRLGRANGTTTASLIDVRSNFDFGGANADLFSTGKIDGSANALQNVNTLTIAAAGDADLSNAANSIAAITGSVTGAGNSLTLVDTGNLAVGDLSAGKDVSLSTAGAGAITVNGTVNAGGVLAVASGTGGITLNAGEILSAPTVDLSATGGGVTQAAGGTINATTLLQSSAGVTGTVKLAGANTLAAIDKFSVTTGDFTASLRGTTTVSGELTADNVDLASIGLSALNVTGTIQTAGTTSLSSGTITVGSTGVVQGTTITISSGVGVAFNGNALVGKAGQTNVLDVSTVIGDVTEASTATINAGMLQSAGNVVGNISLLSASNAIDKIGNLTASGNVIVNTANALTISGLLNATGNVFLRDSNAGGISVGAAGAVNAGANKLASFQADKFSNSGAITGGTFEFALNTPGALTLGAGGTLPSLAGIGTTNVVIGGVTVPAGLPSPGFTVTATSIDTVASFDGNALPVALRSTGTIGEAAASPIVNVATLTGSATAVKLDQANGIANLGSFSATAGDFLLTDPVAALTVSGPVTGTNVSITGATALAVTGSIGATATAALGAVGIDVATTGTVTGSTVQFNAGANGINLNGNAAIGQAGGVVDINSAGTVTQAATSVITAGTLESTGGISNDVSLVGTANAIANLGDFPATGNVALIDGSAVNVIGNVNVIGAGKQLSLQAPSVTVKAGGQLNADTGSGLISLHTDTFGGNSGTIKAATLELAPITLGRGMTLGAAGNLSLASLSGITTGNLVLGAITPPGGVRTTTAGDITIGGTFDTTGVSIVILDGTGAVTQTAPLIGGSQLFGSALSFTLLDADNAIAALGLTATGGNVQVFDKSAVTLAANSATGDIYVASPDTTLTGAVAAGGILGLQTDKFTFVAGSLSGTTVEIAPLTSGTTETLGGAGGLSLLTNAFITGNLRIGAVTVPGSGLTTTAGLIDVGGAFGSAALVLELNSLGGITESGGVLTAANLTGTAGGAVNLNAANVIDTLDSFNAGANPFTLFDNGLAGNLTVNGPVNGSIINIAGAPTITVAGNVAATTKASITSGAGGLVVQTGGNVTGPDVVLTALGGNIALTGTGRIGSAGGTVDLNTSGAGNVTEAAGAVVTAGTLISSSGIAGSLDLSAGSNDIANLGSIVTVGSISINDAGRTGTLGVAGPLSATDVTLISGTGALTVTGSIFASTTIALDGSNPTAGVALNSGAIITAPTISVDGGATGIAINGNASIGTGASTIDLTTTGGGVTEASTAVMTGTLQSTGGVVGNVDLFGTANAIAALGDFAVTGGTSRFALNDSVALTVGGTVTAPGQVYLQTTAPGGITVTGSVGAGTLASFQADALTNAGTISGTQMEWAPATTLATQTVLTLSNIPTNVRLGAVTLPGAGSPVTFAGSIVIGGNFGTPTTNLELDSLGGISEGGAFALTAATLTGTAGGDVALGSANAIATLGSFNDSGFAFTLNDGGLAGNLTVNGPVTGSTIAISGAPTITVAGNVTAGVLAALASGAGGVVVQTGGNVTGTTVALNGSTGGIALTGTGRIGSVGGTVDLTTAGGGVSEAAGAIITAGTLLSSGGVVGNTALGGVNNVATLAGFAVTGGSFALSDGGSASGLVVTGPVTADNVTLDNLIGQLNVGGSIGATGTVSLVGTGATAGVALNNGAVVTGPVININGGTIGITLNGNAQLGSAGGVVDLTTTGNGVIEAATATITAGTLQSTGGITGIVSLAGSANAIANIGTLAVTGGSFSLIDTGNLNVAGPLTASDITIGDSGTLTVSNSLIATGTASLTAAAIAIPGVVNGGSVALFSTSGTIDETGTLIAGTLSGSAAAAATLLGATPTTNKIGILGDFIASGFTLNNGINLSVTGAVNGTSNVTVLDAGTLTIAGGGTIAGAAIGLTADNIAIAGLVTDGGAGTVNLVANAGTISETGAIVAGTLTGSSTAATNLAGATPTTNQISKLGNFSAAGFTLNDGIGLTVVGNVAGGASATILDSGALSIASGATVGATAISLTGDTVAITGLVSDGGAGTVSLVSKVGAITESGTLVVGTLSGSAATSASLLGATTTTNKIATIGNFTATTGFALNDGISVNVTGTLNGGTSVTLLDAGTATIAAGGTVTATAIGLTADNITITGLSTDGGAGTTSLIATTGTIGETGTIIAGTLTGNSAGATTLAGASATTNKIATLGNFTASVFKLNDGINLDVAGTLNGTTSATVLDAGLLTVSGTVTSPAISLTADNISITGLSTDGGGTGTTSLIATTGTISETGALVAGTLTGSSAGLAALTGATLTTNQVSKLGNFTASGFTLDNGTDLTVVGTVNGGPTANLVNSGTLTVAGNGTVSASGILLSATEITIAGLSTDGGGAGTTSLIAATGTISETGTIISGTLSGNSFGTTNLAGANATANQISKIAIFAANGFSLRNGTDLTFTNVLTGGPSVTVLETGNLTIAGTGVVSATAIDLTADNITITGLATDGGAGTTRLVASTGTISETGTIIAGTLSGSAVTTASFAGATPTSNKIATLGSFGATDFSLNNGVALDVTGPLNVSNSATIVDSAALLVSGTIAPTSGTAIAVGLTAAAINITGTVSDGGAGTTSLVSTTGTIAESGTLIAGTLSGSAATSASLLGATTTTNKIATIGNFTAATGFALNDGISVNVTGTLNGGTSVTLLDAGTATIAAGGTVTATAIGLTADNISIQGLSTDGGAGTTNLVASTGTIDETGTIIAGTLTGSSAGATTLAGATATTNKIATLGNFTATVFKLNDGIPLNIAGTLKGSTSATVLDAGLLTVSGTVTSPAISLTADNIAITGLSTDGGAGTTSLIASTGTISETGTIVAGTLTGSSAGATSLTGATATTNKIATLGNFTATVFTLNDGSPLNIAGTLNGSTSATVLDAGLLTVSGTVTSPAISLTADNIAITGLSTDGGAGTTSLIATTGTIDETGAIIAGTLTGNSAGATSLTGATATTNQVVTLGNFTATAFKLNDGIPLNIAGTLTGSTSASVLDAGLLTVSGTVTSPAISLTADNISITGLSTDGGAGTTNLVASTGTISETGTLIAGTLSGSAVTTASFTGATPTTNQVATLGSFSATDFVLNNGVALDVTGPLNVSNSATIVDSAALLVSGTIAPTSGTAIAVGLTAATINITGTVSDGGAGTTSLVSTAGGITETGTLIVGTLSGSAASGGVPQAASLTGPNQVTKLASFSASDFTLNNTINLNVVGPLTASSSVTINDGAALLQVSGTIAPPAGTNIAVSLQAGTIDLPGLVSDGGGGTTSLISTTSINETGTLIAGTLSGSAGQSATLTGPAVSATGPYTNQIATLGNFTANGLIVQSNTPLLVSGIVNGTGLATISSFNGLTVGGTVTAGTINLLGSTLTLPGLVTAGGGGTVNLTARSGAISESGTIMAGTLNGSAATKADLIGTTAITNQIGTLGNFTAEDLTLINGIALTVAGTVTPSKTVTIDDAASLLVSGTIAPPAGTNIAVGLTATSIDITGLVSDGGGGTTSLIATSGTISESGTLIAGTLSGGATGVANLLGTTPTINQIATLGAFTSVGFALNDGKNLVVTGKVDGGPSGTIVDSGTLTVASSGTVTANALSLTAGDINLDGLVTDGGNGTVVLTPALGGRITETGTLIAGTLSGGAGIASVSLTGATPTTNRIRTLGNFTAASLTLNDGISLLVAGSVVGNPAASSGGAVVIQDAGTLTVAGTINAIAGSTKRGVIALTAADIVIPGTLTGNADVMLNATTGAIGETGTIIASTLAGSAAKTASFTGPNQINAVTGFTASGLTLNNVIDLTISGNVNGGPSVTITDKGNLAITATGALSGTNMSLTAASINEVGTLVAGTLIGSTTGNASFTGPGTKISQLGTFASGGTLSITNAVDLLVNGAITAPKIVVDTGANAITLADNTLITTGGVARPQGIVSVFPDSTNSSVGAFFLTSGGFTQRGLATVNDNGSGNSTLRIDATGAADITFDPLNGLEGRTNTWLILGIDTGTATGQVNVKALDVLRTGTSGRTDLTGSVNGLSGSSAAGASGIQPGPNSNFRFNACPIRSVNCVLLPTQGLPTASPLNDIYFGSVFNPDDEDDLLLPIVSDRDY